MSEPCMCDSCEQARALAARWATRPAKRRPPRVKWPRLRWFLAGIMIGSCLARLIAVYPRMGTTVVRVPACTDLQPNPFPEPKSPGIRM